MYFMFGQPIIYSRLGEDDKIKVLHPLLPVGYDDQYATFANNIRNMMNYFHDLSEDMMVLSEEEIQLLLTNIERSMLDLEAFVSEFPRSTCVFAYNVACEHLNNILENAVATIRAVNDRILSEIIFNYRRRDYYLMKLQSTLYSIYSRFFAVTSIVYPGCIAL